MRQVNRHNSRVLAVAVSSRGFGYAILEGRDVLVNWGLLSPATNSLPTFQDMIEKYQVCAVVMETKYYRNSKVRSLARGVADMAKKCGVQLSLMTRCEIRNVFFGDVDATRHQIAEILSDQFPEELGFRLPPERKCYKGEDSRMCLFDAVAIAVASARKRSGKSKDQ
jgi:hypothetical protein